MPRRQLLVLGFRHWSVVAKHVQARKAAGARLVTAHKLHTGAHKAAAHKAQGTAQSAGQQLPRGAGTRQDAPQAPSFAASAVVRGPSAATEAASASKGVFGRLLSRLRPARAPPMHASEAMPSAPSFAAAPLLRQGGATPAVHAPPAPNSILQAAERLAAQAAAKTASSPPAAAASNPLYRFAKLGGGGGEQASGEAAAQANKENLGALRKYAELPQKGAAQLQGAAGPAAKKAGLDAKSLLRYAKLAKK